MLDHILVSLDGSELSERALKYAREVLCDKGHITLLCVVDVPEIAAYNFYPVPVVATEPDQETLIDNLRKQATDYLAEQAKSLQAPDLTVEALVLVGEPASVIVEQAEERKVDAIVMSTHGRSGLSRWLFGSVTQKVLGTMPCPVFVVPGVNPQQNNSQS